MWVNRKLVKYALAGPMRPDQQVTDVELQKGDNLLLVEVSSRPDHGYLFLRITDADGTKLELKDNGELVPVRAISGPGG